MRKFILTLTIFLITFTAFYFLHPFYRLHKEFKAYSSNGFYTAYCPGNSSDTTPKISGSKEGMKISGSFNDENEPFFIFDAESKNLLLNTGYVCSTIFNINISSLKIPYLRDTYISYGQLAEIIPLNISLNLQPPTVKSFKRSHTKNTISNTDVTSKYCFEIVNVFPQNIDCRFYIDKHNSSSNHNSIVLIKDKTTLKTYTLFLEFKVDSSAVVTTPNPENIVSDSIIKLLKTAVNIIM